MLEVQQSVSSNTVNEMLRCTGFVPTCKITKFWDHHIVVHRFSREHGIVRKSVAQRVLNSWIANMASVTPGNRKMQTGRSSFWCRQPYSANIGHVSHWS